MRGEILTFDETTASGLISGDDGARYAFDGSDVQSGAPAAGKRVDFVAVDDRAAQIMILVTAPQPAAALAPAAAPATDGIDWQKLFIDFNGRIRRTHFGIAWLILFAVNFIVGLIPLIGGLISLLLIWPGLAIAVKRLHDMGQTGWLAAIPWVANIFGVIAAFSMVGVSTLLNLEGLENEDPAAVLAVIGPIFGVASIVILINLGFLLWLVFGPSQPGTNRFGPNPKGE